MPHDLRHTFGTLAVQVWQLSDVRAHMGHADITTTMIYAHHVPQADAAERLGRLVAASNSYPNVIRRRNNRWDGELDALLLRT